MQVSNYIQGEVERFQRAEDSARLFEVLIPHYLKSQIRVSKHFQNKYVMFLGVREVFHDFQGQYRGNLDLPFEILQIRPPRSSFVGYIVSLG